MVKKKIKKVKIKKKLNGYFFYGLFFIWIIKY